jgi:hypothetical protein
MASWFTKLIDRVTPWDRGGEVQRRQEDEDERRRREAEARQRYSQPQQQTFSAPTPKTTYNQPSPSQNPVEPPTQRPRSILESLGDRFEANSPQDMAKRLSKGEDALYKGPSFWGQAKNFGVNTAREIVKTPERLITSTEDAVKQGKIDEIDAVLSGRRRDVRVYNADEPGDGDPGLIRGLFSAGRPKTFTSADRSKLEQIRSNLTAQKAKEARYDSGLRRFLYGSEPVDTIQTEYQKNIKDIENSEGMFGMAPQNVQNITKSNPKLAAGITGGLFTALDVLPGGIGARAGTKGIARNIDDVIESSARSVDDATSAVARNADEMVAGADVITQAPARPGQVEIAPGVKVDAPAPQPMPQVEIGGTRWDEPTIGQAIDNPSEVAPALFDADARVLNNPLPLNDPLDVPAYQRRNAASNLEDAMAKYNQLQDRSEALRKAVAPDTNPVRVSEFERRRAGQEYNPVKVEAMDELGRRKAEVTEKSLVETLAEQRKAQEDIDTAIRARSAQEALQEGNPVTVEKPAPVAQAEARAAETPDIVPVDNTGKVIDTADETPAVSPRAVGEGVEVTADDVVTRIELDGRKYDMTEDQLLGRLIDERKTPSVERSIAQQDRINRLTQALKDLRNPAPQVGKTVDAPVIPVRNAQGELPEAVGNRGTAKTGDTKRSKGKGPKRDYETTSFEASIARGRSEASKVSNKDFLDAVNQKRAAGRVPDAVDADTARALQETAERGTPEWAELGRVAGEHVTESAQSMRLANQSTRRLAGSKEISDRFANQVYSKLPDGKTLDKSFFDEADTVNKEFVDARDNLNKTFDEFKGNATKENQQAVIDAVEKAVETDRAARFKEYQLAKKAIGNTRDEKAIKFLGDLQSDAGVYTMDWIDQSMLSSLATMRNNMINSATIAIEEMLLGKAAARRATKKTGETIGGGSGKGFVLGFKEGIKSWNSDRALRKAAPGNAFTKFFKNIVTSGNTAGDGNIMGTVYASTYDHYEQILKSAGFSGDELVYRARVNTLVDPDKIAETYKKSTFSDMGLTTMSKMDQQKLETRLTNGLANKMGNVRGAKTLSKLVVRLSVGFPTIVARTAERGARRATLGVPSSVQAALALRKGTSAGRTEAAQLIKQAWKERGSGAAMYALGTTLYLNDRVSGSYPSDPEERELWEREGKKENAIKIGSDWHSVPSALGVFALPFLLPANVGTALERGDGIGGVANAVGGTLLDSVPVESIVSVPQMLLDWQAGRDVGKKVTQLGASATRALLPVGSFINQVAQMFDPTDNDTNREKLIDEWLAKVQDGLPGLSNKLPSKEVDGVEIKNPSPISKLFGAIGTEQSGGVQKTADIQKQVDDSVKSLSDYGAFSDNVRNILSDDQKVLLDKAKGGKKLGEKEVKDLIDGMTKSVSATEDNQFLEKEQYDDNLAVLKIKRDSLASVPTTTKATLDDYDTQIKRGEIYKKNKTPYSLVKDYKEYGLEDWRALAIPPGEKNHDPEMYDPDLYEALWQLDREMTEAGVSRGKKGKAKYYQKATTSGTGRRSGSGSAAARSSNFTQMPGGLLGGASTKDNKYTAIDRPKSYIPDLQSENKAKTSLKKSISVKKGVQYT